MSQKTPSSVHSLVGLWNVSKHFGSGSTRVDALREVSLDI